MKCVKKNEKYILTVRNPVLKKVEIVDNATNSCAIVGGCNQRKAIFSLQGGK